MVEGRHLHELGAGGRNQVNDLRAHALGVSMMPRRLADRVE
jgi:hypothetical protein